MTTVRSAVSWPNDKTYLFHADDTYDRYDSVTGGLEEAGLPISRWSGLPRSPDAFVWWGAGKAYAFTEDVYFRYDAVADRVDPEYLVPDDPFTVAFGWAGMPDGSGGGTDWRTGVDAAVNWGNGKLYFFKGDSYVRYDITADRVDPGYPRTIAGNWTGLFTEGVDAVVHPGGRFAYFFRGEEFQRFDVDADRVDASGSLDASFRLAPTPPGALAPARLLTAVQANQLMADLVRRGVLTLKSPAFVDGPAGIVSPKPGQRVVVSPPSFGTVRYTNQIAPASAVIDNLDQSMLIALYRLTRWIDSSAPDVTELLHLGIGHGGPNLKDCHNQGRALDLSGFAGQSDGAAFTRSVKKDWGNLPRPPGVKVRISPATDALGYGLFTTAFRFATFECEATAIGPANKWPMPELGGTGFVIYPDYAPDAPAGSANAALRQAHQDHVHMQVGVTVLP
ncbi:hemopexin [Streptomyces sp. PanSC19]|uniref:hemopexin repeat-containing protein n=1 Tax=Streptomyces sp. PanSC19 TaxID=1520455 RepID=UPI000FBCAEE5|nr:hemopexin repeat-containing protein [Streptomyces sp. PanSC19]ROQ33464.1 hemopexin [Streptomyces sp. PanSC19]